MNEQRTEFAAPCPNNAMATHSPNGSGPEDTWRETGQQVPAEQLRSRFVPLLGGMLVFLTCE